MAIEQVGRDYIQLVVPGVNGGIRALARISAIQLVTETDCLGDSLAISVGGKTLLVDGNLDTMREILIGRATAKPSKGTAR